MNKNDLKYIGGRLVTIDRKQLIYINNIQYNMDYYIKYWELIDNDPNIYGYFLISEKCDDKLVARKFIADREYMRSGMNEAAEPFSEVWDVDALLVSDEPIVPTDDCCYPLSVESVSPVGNLVTIPDYLKMFNGKLNREGIKPVKSIFITQRYSGRDMKDIDHERDHIKDLCNHIYGKNYAVHFIDQLHLEDPVETRFDNEDQFAIYCLSRSLTMLRKADVVTLDTHISGYSRGVTVERLICDLYNYKTIYLTYGTSPTRGNVFVKRCDIDNECIKGESPAISEERIDTINE